MFGEDEIIKSHKGRANFIGNFILVCFGLILARLWYLQVYQGDMLYRYSIEIRLRKEILKSPRGMIFTRNNDVLVHNVPRFDVVIIPQYLKNKKQVLEKLSKILDMSVDSIKQQLKRGAGQARYRAITIKKNITRREVAIIETENFKMPGVQVSTFISREYLDKNIGAHLLGYISEISQTQLPKYRNRDDFNYKLGDFIGQAGLEEQMDKQLRGEDGYQYMEVDAQGRMRQALKGSYLFQDIENRTIVPGNNIRLTIDRDLQESAYKALEGKVGSAVAVDVKTGEVLAMVSRPSYDPSRFSTGITSKYWSELTGNENNPLRDRTIQEHYSPGSTFKTITAIAALEEGVVDEKTEVHCPGYFKLGRRKFHCWKKYGHGKTNLVKSLRESCDVYYYKIATKLDIDVLAKYAKLFGFGMKTGIEMPRETNGLIPTKEWKKQRNGVDWQLGETLSCVIGQSFVLSTPLQLAMGYAALANGGKLFKPQLIKEVFSNTGEIKSKFSPILKSEVIISDKTMKLVKKGLFEVVNRRKGTAWWYRGRGINMAGKTGTSQVVRLNAEKLFAKCEEREYKLRHHGIFVSYAPADDPKIAVSVVVEHGCHGSSAAAPVARDVVTTYMSKYYPELKNDYLIEEKKYLKKLEREESIKKQAKKSQGNTDIVNVN